jgi:DNA-binding response OmpR family regulator
VVVVDGDSVPQEALEQRSTPVTDRGLATTQPARQHVGARILLLSDDDVVTDLVTTPLGVAGLDVVRTTTAAEAQTRLRSTHLDLAVVDTRLPELRAVPRRPLGDTSIPVLFLVPDELLETMTTEVGVSGEDYLSMPFKIADLLVRVRLLTSGRGIDRHRRSLTQGDLRLEAASCRAWRGNRELDLTPAEFRLLWELTSHAGSVLSKEQIARRVWGEFRDDNAIERLVSRLRGKVERLGAREPEVIRTHRGFGYSVPRGEP